ncbi:MAG: PAS domain S-box protein [Lutibacter sp.]|nr:PAS domain S-box protein [Lutibacter sp.]
MDRHKDKTKVELIIELKELQHELSFIKSANTKVKSKKLSFENEERYRYLFESNPQPMWIYDIESLSFLDINNAAIHHYGYSKEEFLGMTIKDIRPKEDIAALQKDIELTHQAYNLAGEWRHLKKNGEIIFVEIISHAITINNRKARHVMVNDITLQKKAVEDRTEILMLYNALVDQAGDAFFVHDFEGKFIEVNQQACDTLGYSKEELLKLSVTDVEMDFNLKSAKKEWVKIEAGNKFTLSGHQKRKDGTVFPVEVRFGCAEWKGQKLFLGLARDITERNKAEESLRQSEENLAITLNSIGDGVIATDLKGFIVNMNPVAEKLCGWPMSDAAGKPLTEVFNIVNADTRETVINPVKKVLENGEIIGLANHTILISKNGTEYQISDSAAPIRNKEDKISGVVMVFSDITEKYQNEQLLIENEERLNLFFKQSLTGFFFMETDQPIIWNDTIDKEKILDEALGKLRVTKVNQAMLDQYLSSEDEFINRTLYDFFAHDLKQGRRVIKALFDRGSLHIDTSELRSDGTQMWIEGDYICLYASNGSIKGLFGSQQDITKSKNALIELQLSKTELEEYFENDISADFISTIEGNILSCNSTFLNLFELAEKPLQSKLNIVDFYKNPKQRKNLVTRILKERKVENFEADFVLANGKEKNAILNAIGIFDENDKLIKIRGYIIDVTKQKKAEASIRLSDTSLKIISQGVVITDSNRNVISTNASFNAITGYDESEFIGRTCKFLQGPLSDSLTVKAINDALDQKSDFVGEILNYRKDGTLFWNELTITPLLNHEGLLTNFIGVSQDITKRKQAEERLRHLSQAVEQSPASIILTDTQGNIVYVNPKTLEVTGYELSELIGKNPKIFSAGEKPKEAYNVLWQNIASGKEWRGEFHNKKKNGELFWEQASISPILNEKGQITHYLAVKEDITERKQLIEDLIIAKEQAEQSDKLKSAFLANMSHEIRTPMNGILGFSELLQEPELSGEKQQKYIKIIQKSGVRMLNIINDIVDISKIEAGLMQVDIKELNIEEPIKYIHTFFKPEFEKKGLQFFVKNNTNEKEIIIKTDREKIYAILTNLIKNAIKYTNEGMIVLSYDKKGDFLEFSVKDTGIGIPKDRQEAIFERFIQADISDKMARQGAGLGLSITKAYVEMLGGKIWVESEDEHSVIDKKGGSTFYFTIPCNTGPIIKTDGQKTKFTKTIENTVEKLKILIAEDDEASSLYLSMLVEEISSEILFANDGLEAVEIYKNNPAIDLILMDLQMPHLNGYEATIQIRQLNKNVIIIAQTAFALSYDRQKAIDAGCNDYISKPILKAGFNKLIRKYFNKQES